MANKVRGGPAKPIIETTTGKVQGGPARPAYIIQPGDGYEVEGGPAQPVRVITDPNYPKQDGGALIPVSILASGSRKMTGGPALPIYYVNQPWQPWYRLGGAPAPIQANRFIKQLSYTDAKTNLITPGTLDLTDGLHYPTWSSERGVYFIDGDTDTQYLQTGLTHGDNTYTCFVAFTVSSIAATVGTLFGYFGAAVLYAQRNKATTDVEFGSNAVTLDVAGRALISNTHTLAIAGKRCYIDGIYVGDSGANATLLNDFMLGALGFGASAIQGCGCYITHWAFWGDNLTDAAIWQIHCQTMLEGIEQLIGADELALRQAYTDQDFGAFFCWGMPTFSLTDYATADINPDTFAPTGLDIDQWLDACRDAGVKYAILTTKHQDGFAMWPTSFHATAHAPYCIAATAWYAGAGNPDVVGLFVAGCNARNIKPVLYFSMIDLTYEAQEGIFAWTDPVKYNAMNTAEITELLSNYGTIHAIWLDSYVVGGGGYLVYLNLAYYYNLIKSLQPNCLVITNSTVGPNYVSEIDVYDGATPFADQTRPGEWAALARILDVSWFYHAAAAQGYDAWMDRGTVDAWISTSNARNCTYSMDLQPGTDGHLTAAQVALLETITGGGSIGGNKMPAGDPAPGWYQGVDLPTITTVADERTGGAGANSLEVEISVGQVSASAIIDIVAAGGKYYRMSYWVKISGTTGCSALIYSDTYGTFYGLSSGGTANWKFYGSQFFVPAGINLGHPVIVVTGVPGDYARFDDFSINEVLFDPNLVVNGSFDIDASHWIPYSVTPPTVTIEAGGYSGNCVHLKNVGGIGCISQQIICPPGVYQVVAYGKNGSAGGLVSISATIGDYIGYGQITVVGGPWTGYQNAFAVTSANPYINLWINDIADGADFYFDEIKLIRMNL